MLSGDMSSAHAPSNQCAHHQRERYNIYAQEEGSGGAHRRLTAANASSNAMADLLPCPTFLSGLASYIKSSQAEVTPTNLTAIQPNSTAREATLWESLAQSTQQPVAEWMKVWAVRRGYPLLNVVEVGDAGMQVDQVRSCWSALLTQQSY